LYLVLFAFKLYAYKVILFCSANILLKASLQYAVRIFVYVSEYYTDKTTFCGTHVR